MIVLSFKVASPFICSQLTVFCCYLFFFFVFFSSLHLQIHFNCDRSGGFIDRDYPNMIVATFGIRDADCSPEYGNSGVSSSSVTATTKETMVQCSRCAMQLSLLAQTYRQQMLRYQLNHGTTSKKNSEHSQLLITHVGVHSCSIPVSSKLPPNMQYGDVSNETESKRGKENGTAVSKTGGNAEAKSSGEDDSHHDGSTDSSLAVAVTTTTATTTTNTTTTQEPEIQVKEISITPEQDVEIGNAAIASINADSSDEYNPNAVLHVASNNKKNDSAEIEDNSLIYKVDDSHVDFSVELAWMAKHFHLEVVLSPQAMLMLDRSETVEMKDIIVRDLDTLRSNAYPSRPLLKVFELIAFEHIGCHDPGVLKAIRHYETGLTKYRKRQFKEAMIHFQTGFAMSDDAPSSVMHKRSREFNKQPPPSNWKGEWVLSKSQFDFDEKQEEY